MLSLQSNAHAPQMQAQDIHPEIHPQPAPRTSRKRKSPPTNPEPNPNPMQHMIHAIGAIPPGAIPQPYQQYTAEFNTPGLPPQNSPVAPEDPQQQTQTAPGNPASGRALSSSKRAEQNRKAQRAFRERRDQHVKSLESRSQLLDAALASADEANRRWEECRVLVDQLRVENAALRAALTQQAQLLPPGALNPQPGASLNNHSAHLEESEAANVPGDIKNHSPEAPKEQ
ncbi:hypothetical protein MSAN_00023700 [Mycena sanguinolenta]|uniref:BZIP domain-containing protein n=1 Tax=Mycena sanguinolenta TaxID=230812 RepID=A0A8H7DHY4_9AGAR|nr:hypothetical protein MSAN_00023700 [Mycena sanguinolenta]